MANKPKVLLGMSGGVDSSVAAVLLLEQGFEVIGGFMKNWSDKKCDEEGEFAQCSWRGERRDALRVAASLNIPLVTFDFEAEYRDQVYEYMLAEYEAGRTPNPDVLCNKYMKFGLFLAEAKKMGCDFVATGHYARVHVDDRDQAHLMVGIDSNKDQSYFLCQLTQEQLKHALFPIGHLLKSEVRELARKHKLSVAEKKDSQGICFVGKVEMIDFLRERLPPKPGKIITTDGRVIGEHRGYMYYTVGQRGGLGVSGSEPYYVVERRRDTNEVVVALGDNDPRLYSTSLIGTQITETLSGNLSKIVGQEIQARIRYRQPLVKCVIEKLGQGRVYIRFHEPQRAVAPGQFIAFHLNDELIGSAVIDSTLD